MAKGILVQKMLGSICEAIGYALACVMVAVSILIVGSIMIGAMLIIQFINTDDSPLSSNHSGEDS